MNAPWYDPRRIDWHDGLNPLAIPAYREQRNPFAYRALQHPTMVALRNAAGYEPALYAAPDETFAVLPAGSTYDIIQTLPAGAWIYGISASSDQAEGFKAQITLPTGANLFNKPVSSQSLQGARPYYIRPCGLPDGGGVKLHLVNQSVSPNRCQLVLWVIQP
jgi:hypothetical protein